jgi:regulator of protease activity HflC (stomatin/prohibitin superfamily)
MVEKTALKATDSQARSRIRLHVKGAAPACETHNENQTMLIISFLAIHVLLVLLTGVRIANQYERAVIFRLGKYPRTSGPGLYLLIPVVEWQWTIAMRTITTAVEQQEAITKDNVPVKINAVIWRKTIDSKRTVMEVVNLGYSVVQAAQTALRNVIGQRTFDDVLKEQKAISRALQNSIDDVTQPLGVKVERVQMKNVEIPESMQRATAQEAEALREKRARQIKAQAESEAGAAAAGGGNHHAKPGRARIAPDANDDQGWRRAKHHDDRHDAERIRRRRAGIGQRARGGAVGEY